MSKCSSRRYRSGSDSLSALSTALWRSSVRAVSSSESSHSSWSAQSMLQRARRAARRETHEKDVLVQLFQLAPRQLQLRHLQGGRR